MFCPFCWVQILYILVLEDQRPFFFFLNLIGASTARETEGGNWPPTRILVGALSFKCKTMFPRPSNGVANSRSSPVVSLVWKNHLHQEMGQEWLTSSKHRFEPRGSDMSVKLRSGTKGQRGLRCRLVPEQCAAPQYPPLRSSQNCPGPRLGLHRQAFLKPVP